VIPDGLTKEGEPIEVKCPRPRDGESSLSDVFNRPKFYLTREGNLKDTDPIYNQIQEQIYVMDATQGHLVVYYNDDKGTAETRVITVPRNGDHINILLQKEKEEEKKKQKEKEEEEKKKQKEKEEEENEAVVDADLVGPISGLRVTERK